MAFNVETGLTGIHSRSEETVRISRDFDRGRTTKKELDRTFEEDSSKLVRLQIKAGFTSITDGQIKWQDFLRPFSESLQGLKSGADLSRWFDTNSFYRRPFVVDSIESPETSFLLDYSVGEALKLLKPRKKIKRKIMIPGPYTLASLTAAEHDSKLELIEEFGHALGKVVLGLPKAGFNSVQINEPSLVYRYGESALTNKEHLEKFLSVFSKNFSKSPVEIFLHTYFGDCSKILDDLLTLEGIMGLGIDFTQTALDDIESSKFGEKTLGCGCVDGRNSLIESSNWIARFALESIRTLKPSGVVILPNSELKYLPRGYADEKIRAIGHAAELVRKKVK